jgi:hypothetical protein
MSEIVTYKNAGTSGVYAQIRLDSGERLLLSMAQTGFRVSKLLLGVIPTQTVWDILAKLTDQADPMKHPLDVAIMKVKGCGSIDEVKGTLNAL